MAGELPQLSPRLELLLSTTFYIPHTSQCGQEHGQGEYTSSRCDRGSLPSPAAPFGWPRQVSTQEIAGLHPSTASHPIITTPGGTDLGEGWCPSACSHPAKEDTTCYPSGLCPFDINNPDRQPHRRAPALGHACLALIQPPGSQNHQAHAVCQGSFLHKDNTSRLGEEALSTNT